MKKFFLEVSWSNLDWFIPRFDDFYIDISPHHHNKSSVNLSIWISIFLDPTFPYFCFLSWFCWISTQELPKHGVTLSNSQEWEYLCVCVCLVVRRNDLTAYRIVHRKTFFSESFKTFLHCFLGLSIVVEKSVFTWSLLPLSEISWNLFFNSAF